MQVNKEDELGLGPVLDEDMIEVDIDAAGNLTPEKHDKIIVVDADTIAFAACEVCQYEATVISEDRILAVYDEDLGCFRDIDIDNAILHAKGKIELILERIGGKAENTELHFTSGKNFRYKLLADAFPDNPEMHYKANRGKRKPSPVGLSECKEGLLKHFEGSIHEIVEADDAVVQRKHELKDNCILVIVDKDIYRNTPDYGQPHWNYYEAPWLKNPIEMKWVEMSKKEAKYNQYMQAIQGDKSDNIPGLKGVGPKTAAKFLDEDMDEVELWEGLLAAYHKHCKYGDAEEMAILNMRLVNMHQYKGGEEIVLWEPPIEEGNDNDHFKRQRLSRHK